MHVEQISPLPQKQLVEERYGRPLREVLLWLMYVKGLSHLEIARELDVPPGTVASWFGREGIQAIALAKLKARELLGIA